MGVGAGAGRGRGPGHMDVISSARGRRAARSLGARPPPARPPAASLPPPPLSLLCARSLASPRIIPRRAPGSGPPGLRGPLGRECGRGSPA